MSTLRRDIADGSAHAAAPTAGGTLHRIALAAVAAPKRIIAAAALVMVAGKQSKAMTDQIMAADKARLKTQLGVLSKNDMLAVENAILVHFGMFK